MVQTEILGIVEERFYKNPLKERGVVFKVRNTHGGSLVLHPSRAERRSKSKKVKYRNKKL